MTRWLLDCLEIARQSTVLQLRSTIVRLLAVGCFAVPAIFLAVASRAAPEVRGDDFFGIVAYLVVIQFGLPATVLYLGVAAVHGDLQDRTATYLFVRPVRRSSLLVGKCLAVIAVCWSGAALTLTVLCAALAWSPLPWRLGVAPDSSSLGPFVLGAGVVAIAYTSLVACFAAVLKRPLVIGAVFVVGWEFMVAVAPPAAGVRSISVLDPTRRWLIEHLQPTGELRDVLSMRLDEQLLAPGALDAPLFVVGRVTVVALLIALWVYTRREYDSRPLD